MRDYNDFHWIVRSAGERTTQLCVALIERDFTKEPVTVLYEAPFAKAVEETLRQGHASGKKWTVTLDADVLLFGEGMHQLLQLVKENKHNAFCHQALIYDKLIPMNRPSGTHIYDNSRALEAIQHLPKEGTSLRPESFMTSKMAEAGHKILQTPFLIGLHDFEQYYHDLFRKSILHSNKHTDVLQACEEYWASLKEADFDYTIVLDGCLAGKLLQETLRVDKNFWKEKTTEYLQFIGVTEKPELVITEKLIGELEQQFHSRTIIKSIQQYKNPDHRDTYFRFENYSGRGQGLLKKELKKAGVLLFKAGAKLKRMVG